ncbi:helix-turn-helix domain-containing protein [Phytomonospora endophytica]|uniref:AraC family transcriptional activator FtrA n=1 Tax=Phytomonospora endophytica TaxID=714109 RepID=A0A841FVK6_9ACTN|nr:helix-turn-helix domain-containing protein [Phytomonospora endophytica]MBB6039814.1 AraC family transcriptional activator FtrA [Phytomonospora endophytica]GIG70332.1 AraC family transcriptional regulator [Phytomonospora endophytica]
MHRVVALAHPPQSPFELACAAEVFGLSRTGLPARYSFAVCALEPGVLPTIAGYGMTVGHGLDLLDEAETVVIPGWQGRDVPDAILTALRRAHARGARILAICTAAFVLAEAGLLDGRRATTHWRVAAALAERFPLVAVDEDVLYIDHGDVATSAGTAAGVDLCLHVVRGDHGAAHAAEIARHMVLPPHREGGQSQYARRITPEPEGFGGVLEWAAGRLGTALTVEAMAARARMSSRTFARRFTTELGVPPGEWVLARRIDAARELLERDELTVDAVAGKVGLGSALNLRRHFRARLGTTPAGYRRAFGEARS